MTFLNYLKDKLLPILTYTTVMLFLLFLLSVFHTAIYAITYTAILVFGVGIVLLGYDYWRRRNFYQQMENLQQKIDQKYLVQELVKQPSFLEGQLTMQIIYEAHKAMLEQLKEYQLVINDFKEYIELWIHDIKIPLATATLITDNHKTKETDQIKEELERMQRYLEQVLYYVRSETVEKDYLIKETSLEAVVNPVLKRNKKSFIYKKIKLELHQLSTVVTTDAKWMTFIVNQIIDNSIKYSNQTNPIIKITGKTGKDQVQLIIEDNGVGMSPADLRRAFEKGFTGENGRQNYHATGIGLYLCRRLCERLGQKITITSTKNKGTTVIIHFPKNSYTKLS